MITAIYKSKGAVHARGNVPFMLAYFLLVLCLRKNIRAVHAYKNVEYIDASTLKLFVINSLDKDKDKDNKIKIINRINQNLLHENIINK